LKGFAHEVMKHCKDLAREVNLPLFYDVISNSEFVDIHKVAHGANEYKAGFSNNREYKDSIMFFMIPKERSVFSTRYFHLLISSS